MKILFSAIFCLMIMAHSSFAASHDDRRENIPDFPEMFITDVISILPPELRQVVAKRKNLLIAECKPANWAGSKSTYSISKEGFVEKYGRTPNENGLSSWLINSVEDTFRISFSSSSPDPFQEKFRGNLKSFLWRYLSQTSVIDYKGYQGETTRGITEKIFDSRKIAEDGQKYSALVQLTANLWAAGWKNNGGQVTAVACSFERVNSKYSRIASAASYVGKGTTAKKRQSGKTEAKKRFEGTIEMYVTGWCPVCRDAEIYMKSMGYPYIKFDVEKDPDARNRNARYPGSGVPLIIVGDKNFRGFSADTLEYYMNN